MHASEKCDEWDGISTRVNAGDELSASYNRNLWPALQLIAVLVTESLFDLVEFPSMFSKLKIDDHTICELILPIFSIEMGGCGCFDRAEKSDRGGGPYC